MACSAAWAPPASTMTRLFAGLRRARTHRAAQLCSHTCGGVGGGVLRRGGRTLHQLLCDLTVTDHRLPVCVPTSRNGSDTGLRQPSS